MKIFQKIRSVCQRFFSHPHLILVKSNYDDYWKDKRGSNMGFANSYQVARAEWIAAMIEDGDSVLDVGCGDGAVLLNIKKKRNINAVGADLSEYALDFLSGQGIHAIKFDLTEVSDLDNLPDADHILLLEVLEHLPDPENLLKIVVNKAEKSVFFSFPNSGYIMHRLRYLLGRFPVQWRLHPGEHLRFWTYNDLLWWLDELGYMKQSEIHAYQGIPLLNRIWSSMFAEALIVKIKR